MPDPTKATGSNILRLARKHLGEKYVLGVLAPKDNPGWKGPWDCAEFASWLLYQSASILYGCEDDTGHPATADAYTGYWSRDVGSIGNRVSVEQAARTPGAAVLRVPQAGATGHIVISDGEGGTVEAHSTKRGVIESTLADRRWDTGILVPGITYVEEPSPVEVITPRVVIYRLMDPRMTGPTVKAIQRSLKLAGFNAGVVDGAFGPHTQAGVIAFQLSKGLISDGEVGPKTARLLGVTLPSI